MSARILDGAPVAEKIKTEVAERIASAKAKIEPKLVAIMVGDNASARAYARSQGRACEEVGIAYELRGSARSSPRRNSSTRSPP